MTTELPTECPHTLRTEGSPDPAVSGCWYCAGESDLMSFSLEFDTFVHECCILKALVEDPDDTEAQIMKLEFGI